jgi:hypothetical protein
MVRLGCEKSEGEEEDDELQLEGGGSWYTGG